MLTRQELKAQARKQIQGNIGISFLCFAVYFALILSISMVTALIPIFSILIGMFLMPPLALGLIRVYVEISYGNRPEISLLFSGFQQYTQTFLVSLLLSAVSLPFSLLSSIPAAVIFGIYLVNVSAALNALPLYIVWLIFLSIIFYCIVLGFSMVYYIMVEQPELSAVDVMKASWYMMKGNRWDYFVFTLSFLPWILLCIVTLGFAYIYVAPYLNVASVNYYHNIKHNQLVYPVSVTPTEASYVDTMQESAKAAVTSEELTVIKDIRSTTSPVSEAAEEKETGIVVQNTITAEESETIPRDTATAGESETVVQDITAVKGSETVVQDTGASEEASPVIVEEEEEWSWDNLFK